MERKPSAAARRQHILLKETAPGVWSIQSISETKQDGADGVYVSVLCDVQHVQKLQADGQFIGLDAYITAKLRSKAAVEISLEVLLNMTKGKEKK